MEENLGEAYKLEWWHRGIYFLSSIQDTYALYTFFACMVISQ